MKRVGKFSGRQWVIGVLATVGCAVVGVGFGELMLYANTPGAQAAAGPLWPASATLPMPAAQGRPALIIFAHPRCPCSRATLDELEEILPRVKGLADVYVVFVRPEGEQDEWAQEELWQKAQLMPHVQVVLDRGGVEAARFGAKTSGQALLYSAAGSLVFRGGLTPQRGHVGESNGRHAVITYLTKHLVDTAEASVLAAHSKIPSGPRLLFANTPSAKRCFYFSQNARRRNVALGCGT